jgi:hypothetical protein
MFSNHIDIINLGELLRSLTIEKLGRGIKNGTTKKRN